MNVRFMDTSIVMNLLEVPHMCADAESVKSEFAKAVAEKRDTDSSYVYNYRKRKSYCAYN